MVHNLICENQTQMSETSFSNCSVPQYFSNYSDFAACYRYFSTNQLAKTIGFASLALFITIANILVIISISKSSSQNLIFNQILIGYCVVNGFTGLIDIPLVHFSYIFGYWPLGDTLGYLAVIIDNSLAETTIFHMAYLSYARLRSIIAPGSFRRELLLRHPVILMPFLWILAFVIWTAVVLINGLMPFSMVINYSPPYELVIYSVFFWLLPLFVVLGLCVYLLLLLKRLDSSKKKIMQNNPPKRYANFKHFSIRMDAYKKFQIFSFTFMIQWLSANLIVIIKTLCNDCMSPEWEELAFLLTYLVCFTDAVLILLLNSNSTLCKRKKKYVTN